VSTSNKIGLAFVGVLAVLLAAVLIIGTGESNGGWSPRPIPTPVNDSTMQAINASTDCTELQGIFDEAAAVHDEVSDGDAPNKVETMRRMTGYMNAASERMNDLGCYE
jgi:hypothetical protein